MTKRTTSTRTRRTARKRRPARVEEAPVKRETREGFLNRKRTVSIVVESRFSLLKTMKKTRAAEVAAGKARKILEVFKTTPGLIYDPKKLLKECLGKGIIGNEKEFGIIVRFMKKHGVVEEKYGHLAVTEKYSTPVEEKKKKAPSWWDRQEDMYTK